MSDLTRFEEQILLSIWKLGNNAYGPAIYNHIRELTQKEFALGGIYFMSSHFSLGLEMGLKGGDKFDTSDQFEGENTDGSTGIEGEVDSGGLQLVLFVGYHF